MSVNPGDFALTRIAKKIGMGKMVAKGNPFNCKTQPFVFLLHKNRGRLFLFLYKSYEQSRQ